MPKLGFRKRVGRVVRRVARKGVKYAKRRYISKKGNFRLGRLVKDVAMVKKLVNVEKKNIATTYDLLTGQTNGNGGGANIFDITPNIAKGLDRDDRTGNSVKLTGMHFQGQVQHMSATTDSNLLLIEVWRPRRPAGTAMSLGSTGNELFNNNPFSAHADIQSRRNSDYLYHYKRMAFKYVKVPGDVDAAVNLVRSINFKMGLKLQHHLRWDDNGVLINGQLFMTIRAATGNASTTVATSDPDLAHTAINTGVKVKLAQISYWVDN